MLYTRSELHTTKQPLVVADLGILVAADQVPTHTLSNSTCTQQSRGAEAEHKNKHADVGGSSSGGSAPADDTASGRQGGSSADLGAFLRREWREGGLPLTVSWHVWHK